MPLGTRPCGAPFCDAAPLQVPLPADTLLHGWLQDSLTRLREAELGPELESKLLPASASSFFSFYASAPSALSSSLQSSISALANNRDREACLTAAQQLRPQDGGRALAHFTACSALHASAWKRAAPTQPLTTLLDKQYRIASRLNLGLPPFSSDRQLPADCPLCSKGQNAGGQRPLALLDLRVAVLPGGQHPPPRRQGRLVPRSAAAREGRRCAR